ncbi:Uncharacterised protein [Serratia proteamaculans]|uniref:hypothetical protein n=1 Tax=Serratia proteamaculans TaxID=28151 RepID=UPI0021831B37|nr:hypothetical protein [Serratia proteamaculans]CAI2498104.1 Uncharacterised protein [Serratia proteamaculans]
MSTEKLSELKEALEWLEKTPYGGEWDSALVGGENGKNYHAITNADDEVVRAADDSRHTSWLCDYLEAVSPVKIRALLAELEVKDKRISTLEVLLDKSVQALQMAGVRIEKAETRLATPVAGAQFKPVADLFALGWENGEICAYNTDPEKAMLWLTGYTGTCVQEYVKLERLQEAYTAPPAPAAPATAPDEIEPDSIDKFVAQVCGDLTTSNRK